MIYYINVSYVWNKIFSKNKCSLEVTTHITSVTDVIYGKLADTNYTISEVSTRAKVMEAISGILLFTE